MNFRSIYKFNIFIKPYIFLSDSFKFLYIFSLIRIGPQPEINKININIFLFIIITFIKTGKSKLQKYNLPFPETVSLFKSYFYFVATKVTNLAIIFINAFFDS